jgi:CRISP-associated protein Cas1
LSAIYILSDFGKLQKENETLVFSQPDGTKTILFPYKTEHLLLMGNISISGDALRLITKYKIPVTLVSSNGKFNARFSYEDSKNVLLRQKQYRILDDRKQSLEIARSIVTGKIRNQLSFIQRIKRKDGTALPDITDTVKAVKQNLKPGSLPNGIPKSANRILPHVIFC